MTFKQHLKGVKAKAVSCVALLPSWCIIGSHNKDTTFPPSELSASEYCAPVWCHSPNVKRLGVVLNSALWAVFACQWTTLVNGLPDITPVDVRCKAATPSRRRYNTHASRSSPPTLMSKCCSAQLQLTLPRLTGSKVKMEGPVEVSRTILAAPLHQWLHVHAWPGRALKAVDNSQLPKDLCWLLQCSSEDVGSHRQCCLLVWGPGTDHRAYNQ